MRGFRSISLGPADLITTVRAALALAIAVLVAVSYARSVSVAAVVTLASAALALDTVDGWIARRTGTASDRGARYDMEVDAFLLLVLSIFVARSIGPWVFAIGIARYGWAFVRLLAPWLRASVVPRRWRKVVAAVQGVVLTYAAADLGPRLLRLVALAVALLLLIASFGTEAWELRRQHVGPLSPRVRRAFAWPTTVLAFLLVWAALVAPDRIDGLGIAAFVRIPVEGLLLVVIVLVVPKRAASAVAVLVGLLLAVLTVLRVLDMAFFQTLDRPFDLIGDWGYFNPAVGLLRQSVGPHWTEAAEVGALLLILALLVLLPLAVLRLTRVTTRHRAGSARAVAALGLVWIVSAAFHVQFASGDPLASASATTLAVDQVQQVRATLADRRAFAADLAANDPVSATPTADLLTGLRGKDVLFVFVESYGRVAVEGTPYSPAVDKTLQAGTISLQDAGFSARSAFLRSPTFGGISWLAHSTLHSGLWVDSQQRYDQLMDSNRFTLSDAFHRAGWRTVADVPSNTSYWPQGKSFYHYDQQYGMYDVGYRGPDFGYATIPDEYTLSAFNRMELAKRDRPPLMAEIDLVSSHTPWAALPHLVPWNAVGDGSIFDGVPKSEASPAQVWKSTAGIRAAYSETIQYSLQSLVTFVENAHDPNLVLVMMGDHQPAPVVSGDHATHDVPISIIAKDPSVLAHIASWGWQPGLLPSPNAPAEPMDAFRNRFLAAYDAHPAMLASH